MTDKNEVLSFPIWFEDFPKGCGSCGQIGHEFDDCPKRKQCSTQPAGGTSHDATAQGPEPVMENHDAEGGEWVCIASKKPPTPPRFGNPKDAVFKSIGTNVWYNSESSSSKNSSKSTTHSAFVPPAQDVVPLVGENQARSPSHEMQAPPVPLTADPDDDNPMIDALVSPIAELDEDEEFLDDEGKLGEDGYDNMLDGYTQDELEVVPGESSLMVHQLEQLGVDASSNSESSKRKHGPGDTDTASSILKGSSSKRMKHVP